MEPEDLHFSHVGICVSDLDRARRFYREGLGFEEEGGLRMSNPDVDRLLALEGVDLAAVYLRRDGVRIELLHYPSPGHVGDGAARPMNGLGLTHLSLRVRDLDAASAAFAKAGGRLLEGTRYAVPEHGTAAVFGTDPDGTRIELVQMPGDPSQPPMRPRDGA